MLEVQEYRFSNNHFSQKIRLKVSFLDRVKFLILGYKAEFIIRYHKMI